ncbi:MAG: TetR/AcrR family transcriptional regulator [Candidatus Competibacteraceae bacterium]|nr:TetR/AcrR family transcriptional regulator [Candidatus Competibacteraceae bacterium]
MPWEKSFNEETALEKAMQVFWGKGFEPASIADLLTETGLNRGSLYNAFGGKKQLFVKALLKYDRDNRRTFLASLEALDNPVKAITTFFDTVVDETVADKEKKGCFLFNTALEIATHDETVNEIVTNGVREIEAFFRRSIEVGQARSVMPKALEPEATAKALLALLVAIRVLGRGVFAEAALRTIAEEGKRLIRLPGNSA